MKSLIVAADDFGLAKSINQGIIKAYKEGIITSINYMPSGDDFRDALELAEDIDIKEIGAHLSLTETSPVTDPKLIPSLIAKDGRFYKGRADFVTRLFTGKISYQEVYLELRNQLEALGKTGLKISALNSHEHMHMLPSILNVFIRLAKEYDISFIRSLDTDMIHKPMTFSKIYKLLIINSLGKSMRRSIKEAGVISADNFIGFLDSGKIDEDILADIIRNLKKGVTELICHPGFLSRQVLEKFKFYINCERELYALTSPNVKKLIKGTDIRFITYGYNTVKKDTL